MILFPRWPAVDASQLTIGSLCLILVSEMALGTGIGLLVSFISEALTVGAQILSLQAGFAYASEVDPTSQADSDVLPVLAQLMAGLLFFTTGLHRMVIQAFADSLRTLSAGHVLARPEHREHGDSRRLRYVRGGPAPGVPGTWALIDERSAARAYGADQRATAPGAAGRSSSR